VTRPYTPANYDLYRGQTPAQTVGPFFQQGLTRVRAAGSAPAAGPTPADVISNVLCVEGAEGQRISVEGAVYDGLGDPVVDALIEIWQANSQGRYNHPLDLSQPSGEPCFVGFGRAASDETGAFVFHSIKPGCVPGPSGSIQAPHLSVIVAARGMARHAFTRIYFEADPELLEDPVLSCVPAARRHTLLARSLGERHGVSRFRFDIHLQGDSETVFFEL
jgi:protocatechuate 3,4-dioxygenase, alpha subunit